MKNKKLITGTPLYEEGREAVFGSAINETPKPISQLQEDDGTITVWGDIFDIHTKKSVKGNSKILTFGLTDYTSSVTVKMVGKLVEIDEIIEKITSSNTLIVKGNYLYDVYM